MTRNDEHYRMGVDGTLAERLQHEERTGAREVEGVSRYLPVVGRTLLAVIFVFSGLGKIGGWESTAGYMASKGMFLVPLFLVATILIEVLGGLSVILGFKARYGAALLALFMIPVTLVFHNFWAMTGGEAQMQMIMFMKNLSIIGGLTFIAAFGAGPISLDNRARRRKARTD